jgi:hypothetical protein
LTPPTAMEAQRIGTLPEKELAKALDQARKENDFVSFSDLIVIARPYWYKASRQKKQAPPWPPPNSVSTAGPRRRIACGRVLAPDRRCAAVPLLGHRGRQQCHVDGHAPVARVP